jgi:hypothetical protein
VDKIKSFDLAEIRKPGPGKEQYSTKRTSCLNCAACKHGHLDTRTATDGNVKGERKMSCSSLFLP